MRQFADYRLPYVLSIICVGFIIFGLVILRKAHIDLGENYSQDLEIKEEHVLVTWGIYKYIRHPMYAAGFLISIAQIGLLQNWIAGFSGVIVLSFFYLLRVPAEEEMMIKTFGEDYLSYRSQTKRLIPFI
jgi:protein-S-isoprenylcysteine O-methyltransferase Ste14